MRVPFTVPIAIVVAVAAACLSPLLAAQTAGQQSKAVPQAAVSAAAIDPHDLSGVWMGNYNDSIIPNDIFTPAALKQFNSQKTERPVGDRPIIYDGEKK